MGGVVVTPRSVLVIEESALEQMAALLLDRVGLKITPDGYYGLRLALSARMPALGLSHAGEYVRRLKERAGEHELRALLPLVTVGKTEFFRDTRQFHALETQLIPSILAKARREGRKMRLWSAGCATGEEPYSLAMVAHERGARAAEVDLWATDLNPVAVESAKLGRYAARRLVGVSDARRRRFFDTTPDGLEIKAFLKDYVRFEGLNLAAPVIPRLVPGTLDLILCRNVIIYFDVPTVRRLMDRFIEGLRPGGVLLLGYSESLFRVYERFEMFEVEGTFAYRRPLTSLSPATEKVPPALVAAQDGPVTPPPRRPTPAPVPVATPPSPPGAPSGASLAERLKVLSERARVEAAAARERVKPPPQVEEGRKESPVERFKAVVALINRGDFEKALKLAQELSDDEPNELGVLLTVGNILSLTGQLAPAREIFNTALQREPLCVEARVFGGVALLQSKQLEEARAELAKALFLEPTLAIGHYLLAQVHERLGDLESSRRSYRNAIAQLRHPQRQLAGHYPDMPESGDAVARAARYALAALEEAGPTGR